MRTAACRCCRLRLLLLLAAAAACCGRPPAAGLPPKTNLHQVKGMRTEAADAAYAAGHPPTPWSARAAAATMAAAKPYLDTVQAGEESAQQWDAMAASTESQASALMAQEPTTASHAWTEGFGFSVNIDSIRYLI